MAHSRATWIQKNFNDNYSKDPHTAGLLLESIANRNLSDFRYALEVMKSDPNLVDASTGLSVFQTVLQTPNSSDFIKLCISNGANFYKVMMISLLTIYLIFFGCSERIFLLLHFG